MLSGRGRERPAQHHLRPGRGARGDSSLRRYGVSLLAIVAITTIDLLERIFGTGGLTGNQWAICIGLAASLLVVEEAIKFVLRRRQNLAPTAPAVVTPPHTPPEKENRTCPSTSATAASSRSSTSHPASSGSC